MIDWGFALLLRKYLHQRSSANQPQGTLITLSVTITRLTYGAMLENKLIPAILTQFPDLDAIIIIQQGMHVLTFSLMIHSS